MNDKLNSLPPLHVRHSGALVESINASTHSINLIRYWKTYTWLTNCNRILS